MAALDDQRHGFVEERGLGFRNDGVPYRFVQGGSKAVTRSQDPSRTPHLLQPGAVAVGRGKPLRLGTPPFDSQEVRVDRQREDPLLVTADPEACIQRSRLHAAGRIEDRRRIRVGEDPCAPGGSR